MESFFFRFRFSPFHPFEKHLRIYDIPLYPIHDIPCYGRLPLVPRRHSFRSTIRTPKLVNSLAISHSMWIKTSLRVSPPSPTDTRFFELTCRKWSPQMSRPSMVLGTVPDSVFRDGLAHPNHGEGSWPTMDYLTISSIPPTERSA